jgi:molybdate transport system substrate-binding protein
MTRGAFLLSLAAGCLCWCAGTAAAQTLTVAAASDLQSALPAIVSAFEKETGRKVTLTFGSSGNFFAQIQNGAPFDVFLSADIDYPRRLELRPRRTRQPVRVRARTHRALDAERQRH